ncbi:EF-hand domain-containing protein [Mesorhizobium sp. MSK_1335]|uniref:EF-hand domain-containing protein n=1 Tax=Mesorhizobium montanum TaxID=3072323 RepID=A0ABU4ZYE1_9HYPH|nr:EF-hand domain-containing protein [Mesorhizobium sp. MSK_1335]MDX8528941.1 EF-hand domain-containing protein [Mesorhizobium sp. MSK_1335]
MRSSLSATAAAAAFILLTFPALAQTNGTPAPTPTSGQPGAGQLPDVNGQAGGPTREMIRQMIEQAVKERMQQDRGPEEGNRHEQGNGDGDRWQNHADGGRGDGHRMAGHQGPRMMRSGGMRLMFALLDADGDGSLSENEVQGAIGRIFTAIDENGDGKVDLEEIQSFLHGTNSEDMP